ncbi:MAG: hypothetical protein KDA93_04825 [Planctomycetaceae bacterium]|nr:hypothetical protein [Planctomycetaceae bacterium]
MPRRDTKLESEGAEFLVLGNLLLHGIPAYKTYTNMPGYDIVATWPNKNRSARIQVKSRWATSARAFFIKNFDTDFVVAAFLNRGTARAPEAVRDPDYFILPVSIVKKYYRRQKLDKLVLSDVPHVDRYRNDWHQIKKFLNKRGR